MELTHPHHLTTSRGVDDLLEVSQRPVRKEEKNDLKMKIRSEPRTATEMDGTLHTDFRKSETVEISKNIFNII